MLERGVLKLHLHDHRPTVIHRYRKRLAERGLWDPSLDPLLPEAAVLVPGSPNAPAGFSARESVAAAWDAAAPTYDQEEDRNPILLHLRAAFQQRVAAWMRPGQRVLDLGCGTGRDSLWLLRQGARVSALDISAGMIEALHAKTAHSLGATNPFPNLETRVMGLNELATLLPEREEAYDGAIADFGTLNTVEDLPGFAESLAGLVRPGGWFVAAIMNRFCLWETLYHLARFNPRRATRRWGGRSRSVPLGRHLLDIRYPSLDETRRSFQPWFDLCACRAHPVLLPPPYLGRRLAGSRRWLRVLAAADNRVCGARLAVRMGDHYLIEMRRCGRRPCVDRSVMPGTAEEPVRGLV
jgi:SAM-dependent methyltransferase